MIISSMRAGADMPREIQATSICEVGATLGEGPIWVERDAALWFVDIKAPRVYRFDPETGFGTQSVYNEGEEPTNLLPRNGDTFRLDKGYHPTSTSPGHRGYIFTVLVGRHQRGLIQRFEPKHVHLVDAIPGIQAMRDAFR